MIYYALLAALVLQRLNEVKIGNTNLKRIRSRLLEEPNKKEKIQMLVLHSGWFLSCAVEYEFHGQLLSPIRFSVGIFVLFLCQIVRYASMKELGESWVHLPVAYRGQKSVSTGIYQYCRHPNYAVVALEIMLVPLLAKAYVTAIFFSFLNSVFLWRRIRMEETQMEKVRSL